MNDDTTTTDTAAASKPKARLGTLRALWPFVRRHGGLFTAWLLALALASAATLSLPVAFRQMIDNGFTDGANINRAFLFLFVVAVVLALASAARFYFVSLLGEKVVADLRGRLYGHLIGLDAEFHDRTRSGELVSRLSADSELLRTVVATSMSVALRSSVTVIGSLAMLFVTSPRLAAFALVGIPLAVLPIVLGARRLEKASRASQDRVAWPTPIRWPAKPWEPSAPCRRTRANRTSAAASAPPSPRPWTPRAGASAPRPG